MSYLPMGDIASTEFNSTKYPGIVKPSTASTLVMFKKMQSQLDRIAAVKGIAPIAVDGDVGPGTVSLFGAVKADIAAYAMFLQDIAASTKIALATSAVQIATIADVIADEAENYADSLNAPSNPPKPAPSKPSTLVLSTGQEVPAPMSANILEAWSNLGTTGQLVALAALGGVGWYLVKSSKRSPRRARRR